jgi:hypothetical protein
VRGGREAYFNREDENNAMVNASFLFSFFLFFKLSHVVAVSIKCENMF